MANSPFAFLIIITSVRVWGLIVTAALAGQATYQDTDNNCTEFLYSAPISKIDYLAGRFLGCLAAQLVIFAGIGVAVAFGTHMVFLDPTRLGPDRLASYLLPYVTIVLPNLVIFSAIFFCLAALG